MWFARENRAQSGVRVLHEQGRDEDEGKEESEEKRKCLEAPLPIQTPILELRYVIVLLEHIVSSAFFFFSFFKMMKEAKK